MIDRGHGATARLHLGYQGRLLNGNMTVVRNGRRDPFTTHRRHTARDSLRTTRRSIKSVMFGR
jgi:hypothetical protein